MLYSVQNEFGRVYGIWTAPETEGLSPEEWERRLKLHLAGTAAVKSISNCSLPTSDGDHQDRVIVEVDPRMETTTLEDVHVAVRTISLLSDIEIFENPQEQ